MTAIRESEAPSNFRTLTSARTAVLAVGGAMAGDGHREATRLLGLAWKSLATRWPGPEQHASSQVPLLARAEG
ncbi:hypothetical protein [Streptomyces sp. IBSBF 2435]|uniref:hypothetical protein n=1 Tax=Streptomyces sp. IBSBF 2435 TaxID=2903531 RepID=UPI002FDBCB6E